MNHYETLGVAPNATQDEITAAYRRMARKYHPDVSQEPDAEENFKKVGTAYETLGNAERRAAYDAGGSGEDPSNLEGTAHMIVVETLNRHLMSETPIAQSRADIKRGLANAEQMRSLAARRADQFKKRQGKVKSKGQVNLVEQLLAEGIAGAEREAASHAQTKAVFEHALKLLQDYEDGEQEMVAIKATFIRPDYFFRTL